MQADIEEGEQTQHAAIAHQLGLVEDLTQRSDRERDEQQPKVQLPVSCVMYSTGLAVSSGASPVVRSL